MALALAFGAEMGTAAADLDPDDRRAARVAGLTGAAEHPDLEVVRAFVSFAVHVIAEA